MGEPAGPSVPLVEHLTARRGELLSLAGTLDDTALACRTRNAGWTVGDVLAHVLAADADLILLLESALADPDGGQPPPELTEESDRAEMARCQRLRVAEFTGELRTRGERWARLLSQPRPQSLERSVRVWWMPGVVPLSRVLEDWRTHDAEHAEDIRLALSGRS